MTATPKALQHRQALVRGIKAIGTGISKAAHAVVDHGIKPAADYATAMVVGERAIQAHQRRQAELMAKLHPQASSVIEDQEFRLK